MPISPISSWIKPQNEQFTLAVDTTQAFTVEDLIGDDVGVNGSIIQLKTVAQPSHGTVTPQPDGTYLYQPDPSYLGDDSFTYVVMDQHGNTCTETVYVTVQALPAPQPGLLPPVITGVTDDVGPTQGTVSQGITDDTTPSVRGTSQPGTRVVLFDQGVEIGSAITGEDWTWSITPATALGLGAHELSVVATYADGTGSTPAPYTYTLTVTTEAPPAQPVLPPVITSITDDVGAEQGQVGDCGSTDDLRPTLKGTGEPGSTVALYDNGLLIGKVLVGPDWQWSFTPNQDLSAGQHTFTAIGSHADGSGATPAVYAYTITTTASTTPPVVPVLPPVITGITDDVGSHQGKLADGASTDDNRPTLQGTGQPGSVVSLYDNQILLGTVTVGADWQWSLTPATALPTGTHTFTAIGSHPDGTGSTPAVYSFQLTLTTPATPALLPPVITDVLDDVGPSQGKLTAGGTTDDSTPTVKGTAEPGTRVDLFDNGVKIGEAITGSDWTWSITPASLANGNHVLTAVASRLDGSASCPAPYPFPLVVNASAALAAPVVTVQEDSNHDGWLNQQEAASRLSVTVTIPSGAKAGDILQVGDNTGNIVAKTLSSADLATGFVLFSQAFNTPADGDTFTASAQLKSLAGTGSATGTRTLTVDTSAPQAPVLTLSTDDNNDGFISHAELTAHGALDVRIDLPGSARSGDTVKLSDGQGHTHSHVLTPQDIANRSVAFDNVFPAPADGSALNLNVVLTDPAGNTSAPARDSAVMHTSAATPVITLLHDRDDNGTLTRAELATTSKLDVRIDLPNSAKAGDKLSLWDSDGNGLSRVLSTADITAGQITFSSAFPLPQPNTRIEVNAQITDTQGNLSKVASDAALFDGNYNPVGVDDSFKVQGFATPTITVVAMSKDTGLQDTAGGTWATKDGDAGRALYGKLSSLLTSDMKVQVSSSDHPGVWHDAVISSDGTHWTSVDPQSHPSGWTYNVRIVDGAGRVVNTAEQKIDFSSAALGAPVIDDFGAAAGDHSLKAGSATTDQTLVVNGHSAGGASAAGHTIEVFINGQTNPVGTTVVNEDGTWSLDLTTLTLANGQSQYNFYARETDAPGNTSAWSNKAAITVESPNGALENWSTANANGGGWDNGANNGVHQGKLQTLAGPVNITYTPSSSTYSGVWDLSNHVDPAYFKEFSSTNTRPASGTANGFISGYGSTVTLSFDKAIANPDLWFCQLSGNITITAIDAAGNSVKPVLRYVDNKPSGHSALGVIDGNAINNTTGSGQGIVELVGSYSKIVITQTGYSNAWYGVQVAQKAMTGVGATLLPADDGSITPGAAPASHQGADTLSYSTQAELDQALLNGMEGAQGVDTLVLSGHNMACNLTNHSSVTGQANALQSIEKFDLGAGGKNTLTMSVNDVLHNGQTDLFIKNGKTQIMVSGDASDTLNLTHLLNHGGDAGNWVLNKAPVVIDGVSYHVIDHSTLNASVLVKQGVNISLPALDGSPHATTQFPVVEGNILLNDTDPDGSTKALSVSGVASSAAAVKAGQGVDSLIEGQYGHLIVHANGDYTYIADKSYGMTAPADDVFYYLNRDGNHADALSSAKISIHVTPPYAQVMDVSSPFATEGQALEFTVKTSGSPIDTPISLVLASGSATLGTDVDTTLQVNFGQGWVAVAGNTVLSPAGTTSFRVRVPTVDDQAVETRESFTLTAKTGAANSAGGASGTGTIVDNDLLGLNTQVVGREDTPLVLKWSDFNLQNLANASSNLVVTALPVNGTLQYWKDNAWVGVSANQSISKVTIDAGHLRFVPANNESGIDSYGSAGIGNLKNDYAQAKFSIKNTSGETFDGLLTIDIQPVVDGGEQTVTMNLLGHVSEAPAGKPAFIGSEWYWDKFNFSVNGAASTDTDGSERLMVGLKNLHNTAGQPERLFLADGTLVQADANGIYWVKTTDTVYLTGSHGIGGCNTSADYALYRQEVNGQMKVLDQHVSASKHWTLTSPLVLDLNGDGVQTVSQDNGVHFDLNADGKTERTGWVSRQDGLLVMDRDGDGRIQDGSEMFGQSTQLADGSVAQDGFQALAEQDSNRDGHITAADTHFSALKVWVDANADGVSQQEELHALLDLGITQLGLGAQETDTVQNGNLIGLSGHFTTADGTQHDMADVWFGNSLETGASLDTLLAQAGLEAQASSSTVVDTPIANATPLATPTVAVPQPVPSDWTH